LKAPRRSWQSDDRQLHKGLGDRFDHRRVRQQGRVVDGDHLAAIQLDLIFDCRRGRDQVELELSLEAFLDDLEVKQPEEPTAKSESEGRRVLGLVGQRRVVELQLLQRLLQV